MASVSQHKGSFRVRWREAGKQREKSGFATEEAAWAWYAIEQGTRPAELASVRLATLIEVWWENKLPKLELATIETYTSSYKQRLIRIENTPVANIDAPFIYRWMESLEREGYSPRTINATLTMLGSVLQYAVRTGLIQHNPARGIERLKEERSPIVIPDAGIIRQVAANTTPWAGNMILLAAFTGMRFSELTALDWQHVKPDHVEVRRAVDRDGSFKKPKTTNGVRDIPLTTPAREALASQRALSKKGLVFKARSGRPVNRQNFRKRYWIPAWEDVDAEPCRFHDLRHLFASLMIQAGASKNPKQLQRWMGHSSIVTTFDVYGHLIESDVSRVVEDFDSLAQPASATVIPLR